MTVDPAILTPDHPLPGRGAPIVTATHHHVTGRALHADIPAGYQTAVFGMGCFWGVERLFWQQPGVWVTWVGYAGGVTPHPTYEEVCTGQTGHAEVVCVVFDPDAIPYVQLLRLFFERHDPTQGMRQGGDVGTQYRSVIYTTSVDQADVAQTLRADYQRQLTASGLGAITTVIAPCPVVYPAETYHQQYLAKNPNGYCGLKGTGVVCMV